MRRINVLMIGPQPPNVGGVASYIASLTDVLEKEYETKITHIEPYILLKKGPQGLAIKISRMVHNLFLVTYYCFKNKQIVAHIHSSSQFSFIENSIYIILIKLFSSKVVLHLHAPDFDEFICKQGILKYIMTRIFERSDIVIVLTNHWKELLIAQLNVPERKIRVIPNAASSDAFRHCDTIYCRDKLGLPKDKMIIFSFGNLIERKGFQYLIESIYILNKGGEDLRCYIGGSGEFKEKLISLVENFNLSEYVKLLGYIPKEEVLLWINSADLVVLPSLAEGMPIMMFEVLNCGKALIGTRIAGISEVITSEDYGYLAEPGNSHDLAMKIKMGLYREWDYARILEYAKGFNFNTIGLKVRCIYEELTV